MKNYVVGFMFSPTEQNVILIEKMKPEWQKGLLNGVGGSIEKGETPIEAMVREFKEETGVDTVPTNWTCFCEAFDEQVRLFLFRCTDYNGSMFDRATTMETERIMKRSIMEVVSNSQTITVPNLKYFIPMALNKEVVKAKVKMSLR